MKQSVTLVVIVATLGAAAPAAAQNRREMQMMADIRMLQEQNQQLQVALAALGDTLKETLKALNGRLEDQQNATRKAFADQTLKVDQFTSDLRVVREGVSENNVKIGQLAQEVEALRLSIPQYPPPAAVVPGEPVIDPTTGEPIAGTATQPAVPPPAAPPVTLGPGMSPQRLYETAWADYTASQWELCISGFDTYLRMFPRSEQADEAQYYIGECNFQNGKHLDAVAAYTQVIVNYPRGRSVSLALYKRGLAFERLGQADRARESYDAAIKQFPDTDAARLAKQSLDRLNRTRPPAR